MIVLSMVPLLFGCPVGGVRPLFSEPLPPCRSRNAVDCIIQTRSAKVEEVRPTNDTLPELGIALSGGGSKSAPFAMGVLKRFVDGSDPWIFKADYLSSVSGGGYSAFYMYHKAYLLADAELKPDPVFPGLSRFFIDSRNMNSLSGDPYFVEMRSLDLHRVNVVSLAEAKNGRACMKLTLPNYAFHDPGETTRLQRQEGNAVYQGWVECYQDLLMTHRAPDSGSHVDQGSLAVTFGQLVGESLLLAPIHYFANLVFDWRKRLSPSQYTYLYGIERTYGYVPEPGSVLPTSTRDRRFQMMADCFQFSDLARIYMMDPHKTEATIGGYLPKWILQATGTSGNVGLDLSRKPYDLSTDVFEITFDEFGSGRYHYVRGSPALVGLTVPLAVLSSAAFADTAQRSLVWPRAGVNALLQGINMRWGMDIANYNASDGSRIKHAFLVWPFYFLDDPVTTEKGPTIHLADGGQSGDNLGMISLLRRSVKNIVVVNGENDWQRSPTTDGYISMASLCSVNYYLIQHGYTLVFEADPREPGFGPGKPYDLGEKCKWDKDERVISVPPVEATNTTPLTDEANITPFNWRRRVWVGKVMALAPGETEKRTLNHAPPPAANLSPQKLEGINVYYLMSALDKDAWMRVARHWYNEDSPLGSDRYHAICDGTATDVIDPSRPDEALKYPCGLIEYIHDTMIAKRVARGAGDDPDDEISAENAGKWLFPQTDTKFTTYSNSVYLFRAYRDLGWAAADTLPQAAPELINVFGQHKNSKPDGYEVLYNAETDGASKYAATGETEVCRNTKTRPMSPVFAEHN
ncbi:hypothetical protein PQR75_19170 [Paraburkholderia fungorum]|uniref:hypothetical protein n=1 Tax=Paraburkholderia fungorum TaxID=134537 RepID=UPI0038B97F18